MWFSTSPETLADLNDPFRPVVSAPGRRLQVKLPQVVEVQVEVLVLVKIQQGDSQEECYRAIESIRQE